MAATQATLAEIMRALLLTSLAGLSTTAGGVAIVLLGRPSLKVLGHLLSFAAGVMLFVSFSDLLREATIEIGFLDAHAWFFVGALLFSALEWLVPEPDAATMLALERHMGVEEGGGDDGDADGAGGAGGRRRDKSLLLTGVYTAVGLAAHNAPEGLAVFLSCLGGLQVGVPLMFAIAAHNVPEGMAVAAPLLGAGVRPRVALKWTLLSGACEPLTALLIGVPFSPLLSEYVLQAALAAVAGVMTYVCFTELMPAALKYLKPSEAVRSCLLGMVVIFVSIHYMQGMLAGDGGAASPPPPAGYGSAAQLEHLRPYASPVPPSRVLQRIGLPEPAPASCQSHLCAMPRVPAAPEYAAAAVTSP
eukprot:CAMPEP_0198342364 /NCGR_PEP_ID=MMETSP1450-20131203/51029_1 /TAXON_ID=753684 ORGANISM="Madagascaria erythrocladiodes, Strain CCMP3234" /NCGR_SAMPLE_ID=MMETSP1450 /ASSEMBLY_ACC=CAM_ASM_001115 /LENGTH=359 /DNA_ID=CAMNT_0044047451 /DNA_START=95 /DNA_END=1174 /DNA_ORIENTATION=+